MQSKYRQFIAVLMIIGARTVSSKKTGLKMVMDKPADVCDGFDESKFLLDYSSLEFVQTDDDQFHISGVVTVKETIEAPIKVIVSSSKSVNGMWVSGLINTSWEDVCEEFDHPTKGSAFKETLGPLTKDGHCPFQKGTHEYDELKFESISQMMEKIPRSLIGKWRAKVQFQKDGHVLTCNYFYFTFIRT